MIMLYEFVVWWYTAGWVEAVNRTGNHILAIWRMFSVPVLLRTLFSPWKRIVSAGGKTIGETMRAAGDNLFVVKVSYWIGVR